MPDSVNNPDPSNPPGTPRARDMTDAPRLRFEDRVADGQREIVLIKRGQRFVFRCAVGQEADLLAQLGDMVRRHRHADPADPSGDAAAGLDWFDAAVISHQIGQRISDRFSRYTRKAS